MWVNWCGFKLPNEPERTKPPQASDEQIEMMARVFEMLRNHNSYGMISQPVSEKTREPIKSLVKSIIGSCDD